MKHCKYIEGKIPINIHIEYTAYYQLQPSPQAREGIVGHIPREILRICSFFYIIIILIRQN